MVDRNLEPETPRRQKADPANPGHIGASMPGMVVNVAVQIGDSVVKGQKLLMLEAMKMQTLIAAEQEGKISEISIHPGTQVEAGDLLMTIEV